MAFRSGREGAWPPGRPTLGAWTLGAWIALAISGLAALSGCSWFSSSSSEPAAAPAATCPTVAVLRSLSQTAAFAPGAERKPAGVAFYGVLSDVESTCTRSGDAVLVTLDAVVIGERGPASGGATSVDLQYFIAAIAATGSDEAILSKRTLPVQIAIPAEARRAGITDHVQEWVYLSGRPPGDVRVVLGFQQTPEVVQFYKNFRGR